MSRPTVESRTFRRPTPDSDISESASSLWPLVLLLGEIAARVSGDGTQEREPTPNVELDHGRTDTSGGGRCTVPRSSE